MDKVYVTGYFNPERGLNMGKKKFVENISLFLLSLADSLLILLGLKSGNKCATMKKAWNLKTERPAIK